jgi:putative copper resistance protein D
MENFLLLPRAITAFLFDAGLAGSVGVLLARLWLNFGAEDNPVFPALRNALIVSAAVMVATLPLQLWLLTATMVASSSPDVVLHQLLDVLRQTHAGRILLPDFVISLLLLFFSLKRGQSPRRSIHFLGFALIVMLLAFRSASGHASGDGDFTLNEAVQFLHLTSISIWSGGVIVAGLIVLPRLSYLGHTEESTRIARRLSRSSTVALPLVALSGFYNAWRGLGTSLHLLVHTQWGGLLTLKGGLVTVALALGAINWYSLRGNETLSAWETVQFSRRLRIEAILLIAVLFVSGWLAGSPPATGP